MSYRTSFVASSHFYLTICTVDPVDKVKVTENGHLKAGLIQTSPSAFTVRSNRHIRYVFS